MNRSLTRPLTVGATLSVVLAFCFALSSVAVEAQRSRRRATIADLTALAESGDAQAQLDLGARYDTGEGVTRDFAEAAAWYRRAAEQGNAEAQFNLGNMYDAGEGILQDFAEAVVWYRQAAEQGHAGAQVNLGFKYANGEGVAEDDAEAVSWYRQAAEQGDADAQSNLGLMYADGRGVSQDNVAAHMWLNLAAARLTGEPRELAINTRVRVAALMSREDLGEAQRLAREWRAAPAPAR